MESVSDATLEMLRAMRDSYLEMGRTAQQDGRMATAGIHFRTASMMADAIKQTEEIRFREAKHEEEL